MAAGEKKILSFFSEQMRAAHQLMEGTIRDLTPEQAHWAPPGIANPAGATYAHVVLSEDGMMNGMLKGGAPLFAGAFAGKSGINELPPMPDPKAPGFPDWGRWARKVKVDLEAMRPYAQAVYAATDEYLASLADEDLDRPVDLSAIGLGRSTLGFVFINGLLGNALTHCGEIACLKGLQGRKGYPF